MATAFSLASGQMLDNGHGLTQLVYTTWPEMTDTTLLTRLVYKEHL